MHTLGDVDWQALVDTLPDSLEQVQTDPHGKTLSDVCLKALINTLAVALEYLRPKQLTVHWVI